jgi:hypothetical protein
MNPMLWLVTFSPSGRIRVRLGSTDFPLDLWQMAGEIFVNKRMFVSISANPWDHAAFSIGSIHTIRGMDIPKQEQLSLYLFVKCKIVRRIIA